MMHNHPEVLYAKKGYGNIERLETGFVACASYAIWVTGTECYKDQLTEMLNKVCDGVPGTVPPNSPFKNLVNTLLISVRMQWHNMCTFIDSFYIKLTGVAGFKKGEGLEVGGSLCRSPVFFATTLLLAHGHAGGHEYP
jgi:hypothetical protein